MALDTWLAFFVASWIISISPGSGAIYAMSCGMNHGFRRGFVGTLGLIAGIWTALMVVAHAEDSAGEAEAQLRQARQTETDSRQAFEDGRRAWEKLSTEMRTLSNLLRANDGDLWPPLVDAVKVERGYETALGAALGEDIDASADEAAPVHWRGLPPLAASEPLPDGADQVVEVLAAVGLDRRAVIDERRASAREENTTGDIPDGAPSPFWEHE